MLILELSHIPVPFCHVKVHFLMTSLWKTIGDTYVWSMQNGLTEGATLRSDPKNLGNPCCFKARTSYKHPPYDTRILFSITQIFFPVRAFDGQFSHLPVIGHFWH